MGKCSEVVPAIKIDHAGICEVEPGVAGVELDDIEPALGAEDGKGGFAGDLCRTLGHPDQQPGLILVAENSRIQQACDFHAPHARTQIARSEDGVLLEALCKIVHREPFTVLENRNFAPMFRNGTNRTLEAVD
jgi:hypothetical protein